MYKLKSGEEINIKQNKVDITKKTIDRSDMETVIMKVLICTENPLRLSALSRKTKIYKEKLNYHLKNMIEKGLVISAEENGKKYYAPQTIFWDNEVLDIIFEILTPLVEEIGDNMDYTQIKDIKSSEPIINCVKMALKLFDIEIDKIKRE